MTNYEKLCEAVGIDPCAKCVSLILCCEIEDKHPDFTAAKQIELIKLLKQNCDGYASFSLDYDRLHYYSERFGIYEKHYEDNNTDFAEALAGLTLKLIEARELNKEAVRKVFE